MKRRCMRVISAILLIIMTAAEFCVGAAAEGRELTFYNEVNKKYNANQWFSDEPMDYQYEDGKVYEEGLGFVLSDKEKPYGANVGILDKDGNVVIPFEYAKFSGIIDNKYIIAAKRGKDGNGETEYGLIDYKGNTVIEFGKYSYLKKLTDSSMIAAKGEVVGYQGTKKYGVIDAAENEIVPVEYDLIWDADDKYMRVSKDGKNGIMEHNGKIAIPVEYKGQVSHMYNDVFSVAPGGIGADRSVINSKGEKLFENINGASVVADRLLLIEDAEYKRTYYDFYGNVVDTKGFHVIWGGKDYYFVDKDGKKGITDLNFNVIIPVQYEAVSECGDNAFCLMEDANNDETSEYVDRNGSRINENEAVKELHDGLYKRISDNSIVDAEGKLVLYARNGSLAYCKEGLYLFNANGAGVAVVEYGSGKKLSDYIKGIKLVIGSKTASVYGETVENDVAPIIRDGRTMLPARFIAENLGAEVEWDDNTQSVIVRTPNAFTDVPTLELKINSHRYKWLGSELETDAAPFVENGRTYVPVRLLAESLYADVAWDESTQTVFIYK